MTKDRSAKQAAHEAADEQGIPYVAARRQAQASKPNFPEPEFELSTRVDPRGCNSEGMPFQAWQIKILAWKDEDGNGYDENTDDGMFDTAGSAVAVLYPGAQHDPSFALDMDASDEQVTVLGSYLVGGEDDGYSGAAASSLFDEDDFGFLPDVLLVGEVDIHPKFRGGNYPQLLMDALATVFESGLGVIAVQPSGRGEGGAAYWKARGFARHEETPVYIRRLEES